MDPADRELMDQLAKGPFEREGFDQRLRQRIVERVGQQAGRARQRRTAVWPWPLAALASCVIVLIAVWLWNHQSVTDRLSFVKTHSVASNTLQASASPAAFVPLADQPKKYALLVGLRTDDASQSVPVSQYRTILVADKSQPEELQVMADLPGLYMPFGQNFWQIIDAESPDHRHALRAVQVTGRKSGQSAEPDVAGVPDYVLSERVSYAGNEYLSIQATVKDDQGQTTDRWQIKHIGQMNERADRPEAEPHTLLQDVLPDLEPKPESSAQWSIYRNPGKWVSEVYDPATGDSRMLSNLPDSVIHNDELLMDWPDIEKIEPGARDAFTYGNVLGVVTDREIVVRSMKNGAAVSAPVHVPLTEGESVVMIQWAQNDKIDYVDKWIQDFQGLTSKNP